MTPFTEHDLINLNAYLDDELSPGERVAFEQRLAVEPTLRQELDALRTTVAVLKMAERVRVPRNFTLDPATYGTPAKRSLLERLGFIGLPQVVAVGGTLVAAFVCAGLVLYGSGMGGAGAPAAIMEEVADAPQATEESLAYDTQADAAEGEAEETEAPEEEAEAAATEEAADEGFDFDTPEPDFGSTGSGGAGGAGGTGGGPAGSTGALATATSDELSALTTMQAGEATNQRSTTAIAEAPPQTTDEPSITAIEQAVPAEPTRETDDDDPTSNTPTPINSLVPIAIAVLLIALIAGGVLARRARRR